MKKRLVRWVILLAIGFGIGSAIGFFQGKEEQKSGAISVSPDDKQVGKKQSQYKFNLTDHNGNQVTQDSYAGSYKLIFFGFTFCPAICPTELAKMATIMDELGEKSKKIIPILISVDPERDTPEVMKEYVAQFHPKIIGLTGTKDQIDATKKSYRIYSKKVENGVTTEYMVDHSSFLYFMDQDNNLIALYSTKDSASKIIEEIKKLL